MKTMNYQVSFSVILVLAMLGGRLSAQQEQKEFEPHRDFMNRTMTAASSDYVARPGSHVQDAEAFEKMRQHILTMYRGVEITHSFVLDSSHYDCIPVAQQPTLRILGLKTIASPPPQSILATPARATGTTIKPALQLDPEKPFDQFGNSVYCEEHTFPMRRITLETMTHFPTLRQFFSKYPDALPQVPGQPAATDGHKWAYTEQTVNNLGGNSRLNVWAPYVNMSLGEILSLGQEWYIGGTGSQMQTEEVGWVVYPAKFGDQKPHLFIYSTSDNYATDIDCYDYDCGKFVRVASNVILGGVLPSSTLGGTQSDFSAEYWLHQGNWWLAINGTWIGYYPGSIYRGGQNSKYAQVIRFGTETATIPGTSLWGPQGSGIWAGWGLGYAAYQSDLWYINTSGQSAWTSLTPVQKSITCYTISGSFSSRPPYFYAGGPGGTGCE